MRERDLVADILTVLKKEGCVAVKIHRSPFQRHVVDILGVRPVQCVDGKGTCFGVGLAIEVKRPGEKPTPLQKRFLDDWSFAGGRAGVAYSVEDALRIVRGEE